MEFYDQTVAMSKGNWINAGKTVLSRATGLKMQYGLWIEAGMTPNTNLAVRHLDGNCQKLH